MNNTITDVPGIRVGNAHDCTGATGCTVVLCGDGAVAGVDIRGGAPGTREIASLSPANLISKVHAVYLAGGSAFGLDGAAGVVRYLEEHDIGFDVGVGRVPIVPGAVLFDLAVGNPKARPTPEMSYQACLDASEGPVLQGNVGAGCGASVGKVAGMNRTMKSGLGSASIRVGNLVVGAVVAVNAFGDVIDPDTGAILAGTRSEDGKCCIDSRTLMAQAVAAEHVVSDTEVFSGNTTIGVVATNALLTKSDATRVAMMAHDGYARSIRPVHTMVDGDTIFALSTGTVGANLSTIGSLAADVMAMAVVASIINTRGAFGIPSIADLDDTNSS